MILSKPLLGRVLGSLVLTFGIVLCFGCASKRGTSELTDSGSRQEPGDVELPATVRAKLAEVARQNRQLAEALRQKDEQLHSALQELQKWREGKVQEKALSSTSPLSDETSGNLEEQLRLERARREALMRELEELRREIASPFGENRVPEPEYLAVKQELVDLRRRIQEMEEKQRSLPLQRTGPPSDLPGGEALLAEEQRLASEIQVELATTRARVAELEDQLAATRGELQKVAELASENASLRDQLLEEKRRAEALEAKLKVAARVTELIFRMRSEANHGVSPTNPAQSP